MLEQRVWARAAVAEDVEAVALRLGVHHEVVVLDGGAPSVPRDHVDAQRVCVLVGEQVDDVISEPVLAVYCCNGKISFIYRYIVLAYTGQLSRNLRESFRNVDFPEGGSGKISNNIPTPTKLTLYTPLPPLHNFVFQCQVPKQHDTRLREYSSYSLISCLARYDSEK